MFHFNFGKKKPDNKQIIIVSIVVSAIVATLSQCTGVSENGIWDLLDEIQRKYFPQTILNELVIKDPEKLNRRVERDVSRSINEAITDYNRFIEEADKKYKPRYVEEVNDESVCFTDECKALAPPMRICAPWVDDCPKD
jgi:siderophore synthetase component